MGLAHTISALPWIAGDIVSAFGYFTSIVSPFLGTVLLTRKSMSEKGPGGRERSYR